MRIAGWLEGSIESSLSCPRGHHLRDGWVITGEQPVRCQHRDYRGAPPCNLMTWVIVTRSGAVFAAEVDLDDVKTIKQHASVHDTLRYLGAPMWPPRTPTRKKAA